MFAEEMSFHFQDPGAFGVQLDAMNENTLL